MVVADLRQSANGILTQLNERDVTAIAALGTLGAGGVVLAQEVADRVLPILNQPRNPTSASGFGASALVKALGATATAAIGMRFDTAGRAAAGILAFGMLASAGADFFNVLQRGGIPGAQPAARNTQSRTGGTGVSRSSSGMSQATGGGNGASAPAASISV